MGFTNRPISPGGLGEAAPPVPIPNTEVKRLSAYDTALATEWENRSPPGDISSQKPPHLLHIPSLRPRWFNPMDSSLSILYPMEPRFEDPEQAGIPVSFRLGFDSAGRMHQAESLRYCAFTHK